MDDKATRDFNNKFNKLNKENKRYVIAIQQALLFAQSSAVETEVQIENEKKILEHTECSI